MRESGITRDREGELVCACVYMSATCRSRVVQVQVQDTSVTLTLSSAHTHRHRHTPAKCRSRVVQVEDANVILRQSSVQIASACQYLLKDVCECMLLNKAGGDLQLGKGLVFFLQLPAQKALKRGFFFKPSIFFVGYSVL